jgi:hypothetical protein
MRNCVTLLFIEPVATTAMMNMVGSETDKTNVPVILVQHYFHTGWRGMCAGHNANVADISIFVIPKLYFQNMC